MTGEKWRELGEQIKLIICDMDGTLLNENKEISAKNREAIRYAKSRGVDFSLCTGRIHIMTECYCQELAQEFPIIAANGAVVWDPIKKISLWELPMDTKEALRIIDYGEKHDLDYIAITAKGCYYSKKSIRKQRFLQYNAIATQKGYETMKVLPIEERFETLKRESIYKILICEVQETRYQQVEHFLQTLQQTEYTSSEPTLLDISCKGVSKGTGLERLSNIMEIPREAICAMGDYENDISMLQYAGLGVAMGNASDVVKAKADYITDTNEEDGVANLIERLLR